MIRRIAVLAVTALLAAPAAAVDLMGVYELAKDNDPQLRAAEFRRDATGEALPQARAALLPQLDASAWQTIGESERRALGETLLDADIDQYQYGVNLRQSIYSDANYGRLRRARAEAAQADFQYEVDVQAFLMRVAERYFEVLTAIDSLEFARAEQTALQRQFEQADQRFEVGLSAITDVHEARAAYDAARARVIVAENALDDAREALRETTGTWFEHYDELREELPLNPPVPAEATDWVDMAIASNPELQARVMATEIAAADVRTARAGHLPSLDLEAGYNRSTNKEAIFASDTDFFTAGQRERGWNARLILSVPIFEGFAVNSRTRQARYNLFAADEDLDQAQRAVRRQTENAFRAVMAGIQEVEARAQAVVSAESALEATRAGFEVGTRTIVEVLISEQNYFQAQRDYSQARHELILNNLRLRQAVGLLDAENLAEVNALLL